MEKKKSPKADLQSNKTLFLEIGFALSLLTVILILSCSQQEKHIEVFDMGLTPAEVQLVEITRDPPPSETTIQTIAVVSDILTIVRDDKMINTDFSWDEFSEGASIVIPKIDRAEKTIENEDPYLRVEVMPKFMNGDLETFRNWVQSRLVYPQLAADNGVQGRVTISFVIEKDGRLTTLEILQTPDRTLSEEALRVLAQSPQWTPGKDGGIPARVKFILPVDFRLN